MKDKTNALNQKQFQDFRLFEPPYDFDGNCKNRESVFHLLILIYLSSDFIKSVTAKKDCVRFKLS